MGVIERRLEAAAHSSGILPIGETLAMTYLGRFDYVVCWGQRRSWPEYLGLVGHKPIGKLGIFGYSPTCLVIANRLGRATWYQLQYFADAAVDDEEALVVRMVNGSIMGGFRLERFHGRASELPDLARDLNAVRAALDNQI